MERALGRIENHIEQWREQDQRRKAQAEAGRKELWDEATERERLLAQAINEEESRKPVEETAGEKRVVFVFHSEEGSRALRESAGKRVRLMSVVPGKDGYGGEGGVRGSWLIFEEHL